jgi:uncharacterized membrane protein YqjE
MAQENLLEALKNLLGTAAAVVQTRLELFSTDVQIAQTRLISVFVMIILTLFFLFFGLIMLALLIVIYSWESNRILALSLLTAGFLGIGLIMALVVKQTLKTMPKLFEASIAELAKDRADLNR